MAPPKLNGRWSWHYDACVRCGRTKYPHCGDGFCKNCFNYQNNVLPKLKGRISAKEYERRLMSPVKFRKGEDSGLDRAGAEKKMSQYLKELRKSLRTHEKKSEKKS